MKTKYFTSGMPYSGMLGREGLEIEGAFFHPSIHPRGPLTALSHGVAFTPGATSDPETLFSAWADALEAYEGKEVYTTDVTPEGHLGADGVLLVNVEGSYVIEKGHSDILGPVATLRKIKPQRVYLNILEAARQCTPKQGKDMSYARMAEAIRLGLRARKAVVSYDWTAEFLRY